MTNHEEQGLRPIGDLLPTIARLPKGSASIPIAPRPSSEITGSEFPGCAVSSSTGRLPTEIAAAMSELASALTVRDSDRVELVVVRSLKLLAPSRLRSTSAAPDWELTGYELLQPLDSGDLAWIVPIVERINAPAPSGVVLQAAARCLSLTSARPHDVDDIKARLAGLVDELAEFPEDVVATAFRKWARREKWWPSLAEVIEVCQRATRWRRSLAGLVRP